jgi:hypothetical protein
MFLCGLDVKKKKKDAAIIDSLYKIKRWRSKMRLGNNGARHILKAQTTLNCFIYVCNVLPLSIKDRLADNGCARLVCFY